MLISKELRHVSSVLAIIIDLWSAGCDFFGLHPFSGVMMRVFITGNNGQLGSALKARLADHVVDGADLPAWDMTDLRQVRASIHDSHPDIVIHSAALTNVDYCANHPREAVRVNGVGTYNIALACREVDALMVAISTNEVFDGRSARPYQEYDARNPINAYAYSKVVAEQVVERFALRYQIVRTAWLYAPGGVNFIHKIISRAQSGEPLSVVTDEVGSPTYAVDLADAVARLMLTDLPGIYHLVNAGECSRFEFAQAILDAAGLGQVPIEPITSAEFVRASTPPAYAPLDNMFGAAAGVEMRPWRDALEAYVQAHVQKAHS
jgi:dTDP-4-dehydrorhamnose reductase